MLLSLVEMEEARKSKRQLEGVTCPACLLQKSRILRVGIRENPEAPVYICDHCRLQHIESRWKTEAELRDYYRAEYREHHEARLGARFSPEERFHYQRIFAEESLKRFKEDIPEGGSLLEIGCSAGGFLAGLKSMGGEPDRHELYGAEWNPEDAEWNRKCGTPCEEGLLDDIYPGKTFSIIVAIHVFEHQVDPLAWLQRVKKRLIGGGWLYLEVPHANDPLSAIYLVKEYQDFFYRDSHITYWLPHLLHWFLDTVGLEATVTPMQRYGLLNHLNWILNKAPMEDGLLARGLLRAVPKAHPMASAMNRLLEKLDIEYRLSLKGLWASDSLAITARRMEI